MPQSPIAEPRIRTRPFRTQARTSGRPLRFQARRVHGIGKAACGRDAALDAAAGAAGAAVVVSRSRLAPLLQRASGPYRGWGCDCRSGASRDRAVSARIATRVRPRLTALARPSLNNCRIPPGSRQHRLRRPGAGWGRPGRRGPERRAPDLRRAPQGARRHSNASRRGSGFTAPPIPRFQSMARRAPPCRIWPAGVLRADSKVANTSCRLLARGMGYGAKIYPLGQGGEGRPEATGPSPIKHLQQAARPPFGHRQGARAGRPDDINGNRS